MKVQLGFLLRSETFSVDLPEQVEPNLELASTVGVTAGSPFSVQCGHRETVDFSSFGWVREKASGSTEHVDIYRVPDDPFVVMPVWKLNGYVLWMQLRSVSVSQLRDTLATYVGNVSPWIDERGIPRIRLGRALNPGNPWSEIINRDHALFRVRGEKRMLILRHDGALGSGGVSYDGDFALVSVTTPLGITVLCDGPRARHNELLAESRAVADSLRLVA
jgi:hypothetical protein